MVAGESAVQRAVEAFAAELARWRVERGLTKKQLATEMGFDPSYVSHVEGRRHRPTEDFARRAEMILAADGAIWRRFKEFDEVRRAGRLAVATNPGRDPPVPEQWLPPGTGLIVEQETAELAKVDAGYRCSVRRALYNASTEPVSRYLIRIAVDRFPGEADRSNRHHREHPLRWDELDLRAVCLAGDGSTSTPDPVGWEPMDWRAKHDRDAFKEVWLLFENANSRFPLYPGQRTTIEYAYTVGADKWGPWFQRAVRLPTRRLTVRLNFPAALSPAVWGVETSLSAEEVPLRTPIAAQTIEDRIIFEWATESPPLNARYRLQWRFRTPSDSDAPGQPPAAVRASERMRAAGVVQRGADLLRQRARPFVLPRDEGIARDIVGRLFATLDRVGELHVFGKGVGLAAPQIGLGWSAAIVRPPDAEDEPVVMLNPRVTAASSDVDEQYEGCLSFFDQRGLVRRALRIEVEHVRFDGTRTITSYELAMARLIAHEIDHLEGRLYVDRMPPGAALVPVEEYRETGRPWTY